MLVIYPSTRNPFGIPSLQIPPAYAHHQQGKLVVAVVKQNSSTLFDSKHRKAYPAPRLIAREVDPIPEDAIIAPPQRPESPVVEKSSAGAKKPEKPKGPPPPPPVAWPEEWYKQHSVPDRLTIARLGMTDKVMTVLHLCKYAMFPDVGPGGMYDAKALDDVLRRVLLAKRVALDSSEAQVIFVHAKGIKHLNGLAKLIRRRAAHPVMFYAYGCDVDGEWPERPLRSIWHIGEHIFIVPLSQTDDTLYVGGVLSFTPKVLLERPDEVLQLVRECQTDQFWQVYWTPSAMALIDEIELFDESAGVYKEE